MLMHLLPVWWGVKFMPGGHSTFFGLLNTFVHIIMYTYYMLAAMGPHVQKYLWWKKYLTMLQMVQFVGIFTHCFQLIFHNPCNYSYIFVYWIGGHGVLFYFLFRSFYKQAYVAREAARPKAKTIIVDDNENIVEWRKPYETKRDSITQINKALAKHL
jgi:elongation of very long chain fatty acids protein 7